METPREPLIGTELRKAAKAEASVCYSFASSSRDVRSFDETVKLKAVGTYGWYDLEGPDRVVDSLFLADWESDEEVSWVVPNGEVSIYKE